MLCALLCSLGSSVTLLLSSCLIFSVLLLLLLGQKTKLVNIVIDKYVKLFEFIESQITLPDGMVEEGKRWLWSTIDITRESLAVSAFIARVHGSWDMNGLLNGYYLLKLFAFDSDGRAWHLSAFQSHAFLVRIV